MATAPIKNVEYGLEKIFEGGRAALKSVGVQVESLACIASLDDNKITFVD